MDPQVTPRHTEPTDHQIVLSRRDFALALAAAGIVTAIPSIFITSCVCNNGANSETEEWKSRYDWECVVQQDNGFKAYIKNGQKLSEAGVDVSEFDGLIDWTAVKASGADFAIIRVGYRGYGKGSIILDDYFLANISGASSAGLKIGVYIFSQAISESEARDEARYVIQTVEGTGVKLSLPIVFDEEVNSSEESRTRDLTGEQFNKNAIAFCKEVESAGYSPMVYGNKHALANLDLTGELAGYDVWYAEYDVDEPTGKVDFTYWQYSASGDVAGFETTSGEVDVDIHFLGE